MHSLLHGCLFHSPTTLNVRSFWLMVIGCYTFLFQAFVLLIFFVTTASIWHCNIYAFEHLGFVTVICYKQLSLKHCHWHFITESAFNSSSPSWFICVLHYMTTVMYCTCRLFKIKQNQSFKRAHRFFKVVIITYKYISQYYFPKLAFLSIMLFFMRIKNASAITNIWYSKAIEETF